MFGFYLQRRLKMGSDAKIHALIVDDRIEGQRTTDELSGRRSHGQRSHGLSEAVTGRVAEWLDELATHIHQVLWVVDVQQAKLLYVSPGYERIWGRSCQSLIDNVHSYLDVVHPLDRERMARENARMAETGYANSEARILTADGTVRWVWIRSYPVMKEGQIAHLVGITEDITDWKRLAMERDALLSRFQLYIESLPLAYLLLDKDLRVTDWNRTAERIFGYSKQEMLGHGPPYEKLLPPSCWPSVQQILGRTRNGQTQAPSINENLTKDGRTITCEWLTTPVFDEAGRFDGIISVALDVTERKALEEQFQQAQKMEVIGRLAGGVAHDFNNLLAVILGCCQFLENEPALSQDSREMVEDMQKAAVQAAGLTRQLLAFGRRQILQPRVTNLNEVVSESVRILDRVIGEDISLSTRLCPALWSTRVDPAQMNQVIMNLAVNARDAMTVGGTLTIETANVELDELYAETHLDVKPGKYVLLSISDNGCGMDEKTKSRVFEPFFTTKESGKGTGLGLSTVYGIVKQSEGHVLVDSELGEGTTFKIYLPTDDSDAVRREQKRRDPPRGSEIVLVVEDEDVLRKFTCRILQSQGYTVLHARNGEEALSVCAGCSQAIDLLVTDVVMPKLGGRQLYDRLRVSCPELKVLYMSGYNDDAVLRHGVLEAETNFIQKPFTYAGLAGTVRDILDGTAQAPCCEVARGV